MCRYSVEERRTGSGGADEAQNGEIALIIENSINRMEENGVDYDGIGIQSHYGSVKKTADIYAFCERLAAYGKRLKITEYDFTTEDKTLQAAFTRDLMIASFSCDAVDGFYLRGFKGGAGNRYVLFPNDYTDVGGAITVRSYYGSYEIKVVANGTTKTVSVDCCKGNDNTFEIVMP